MQNVFKDIKILRNWGLQIIRILTKLQKAITMQNRFKRIKILRS